ncbi:glycosyltransferase family 2 protein [Shimia biformata]|uniref:glycosyltransferase family 2 protein n=1 Tax=Shimia biformata TaxID=1294299 RepID=UPI0019526218|nr:glycosyltransferase family 2 protein [Shimia biformata]
MKDEAPYILDWVAHYKSIGVTDIVVFTNDCNDPTDHILRELNRLGEVHHRFSRVMKRGPHKSALMWAQYEPVVAEADWILVADVDEYLQINVGDGTLPGLINMHPDVDAISFVWKIFGSMGVEDISDRPVPRQFTRCQPAKGQPGEHRFFKTMYRNSKDFDRMGVHRPFLTAEPGPLKWITPDGTRLTEDQTRKALFVHDTYGYEAAQLNHYALRSLNSFVIKQKRGRANHQNGKIELGYWSKFDKNDEVDLKLAQAFGTAEAYRDRLFEQSERLVKLQAEAIDTHRRRAMRIKRRNDDIKAMLKAIQRLSSQEPEVGEAATDNARNAA